jgi:hypothetical protein
LRVMGRFPGVPLSDGGLLYVGPDCETGIAKAEFWQTGAVRSRLMELPDHPLGPYLPHVLADEQVTYLVRSPKDVVVGFKSTDTDHSPLGTYIAAFDGKGWTNLSPPVEGELLELHGAADGTLWLIVSSGTDNQVWRRLPKQDWQDVTPPVLAEHTNSPPELTLDEAGAPWMEMSSARVMLHWEGAAWRVYTLPSLSTPDAPCTTWGFALDKRKEPLVIGDCGDRKALLRLSPAPSLIEQ